MWRIICYLLAISTANVVTASFAPAQIGPLLIPWGSYFIGVTFIFRDLVQTKYGKANAYKAIAGALALSAIVSYLLGDSLMIVAASAITFALAESADTEVFSRIKKAFHTRVLASGLVGGTIDSVVFVIIGLSPIGAGFVPWAAVPYAILGQLIIKFVMQFVGAGVIYMAFKKKIDAEYNR